MPTSTLPLTRKFTIIAQDPSLTYGGKIVRAEIDVPAEVLGTGPCGYRVQVIDYDASRDVMYRQLECKLEGKDLLPDTYKGRNDHALLTDFRFHSQNVYAIVMRILARFEFALGRRVGWSFYGHQLKVAPHAFQDANAFYSKRDNGLFLGYFAGRKDTVFTCLSHDVVAHETTHALVDGLRERYTDPSSADQAAFHEGFADTVALLSVFAMEEVVAVALKLAAKRKGGNGVKDGLLPKKLCNATYLRETVLFGLADQVGEELSGVRGQPLRRSAEMTPSKKYYLDDSEYLEPHRRGEILVAAMMQAFLDIWVERLSTLGEVRPGWLDCNRVVEEGAVSADHLLTIAIRSLDYCPPVHITFGDFLSALLTADLEACPDDSRYGYRKHLLTSFAGYGITPSAKGSQDTWERTPLVPSHERIHFESLTRDPVEVFRFIWENRGELELKEGVFARVLSVRPCIRVGPDGFILRETVAEYLQVAQLTADELWGEFRIKKPAEMPGNTAITLYGGGTLIFDEFGDLKFHIHNHLDRPKKQSERLEYLWKSGFFDAGQGTQRFAQMHRLRALARPGSTSMEGWE